MALPTLDRYRQANPNDTRSDEDVLWFLSNELASRGTLDKYPDIASYAQDQREAFNRANPPSLASELGRGLLRGTDTAEGQLYSTVAQAGAAAQVPALEQWGMQGYHRNQAEAAENPPTVGSYTGVNDFSDALRYGLGVVGGNAPQLVGSMVGAAAGGLAGTAIGGPGGGLLGAAIGGGLASYTQSQNYGDLVDSGAEDALATSTVVGAASSLLETYVPIKIISKLGLTGAVSQAGGSVIREGLESVLSRVPQVARRVLAEAAETGFEEATTEVAQELVAIAGEEYANRHNPDFKLTPEQITNRLIDNGLGGLILGGAAGGLAGLKGHEHTHAETPIASPEVPQEIPATTQTPSGAESPIVTPPAPARAMDEVPPVPTQTPVTSEAKEIINKVDSDGSAPAFISRNLERVANENGIEVTNQMTPNDVIEKLREKDLAPTEVIEAVAPKKPINISAYEAAFDPFQGMRDAFMGEDVGGPTPVDEIVNDARVASTAKDKEVQSMVQAVMEEETGEDMKNANVAVASYVESNEFNDTAPKIYSVPSTGTLGERVVPLTEGLNKNNSRANIQRMVVLYDRKSGLTTALGLYHGAKDTLVATGAKGMTKAQVAKDIGMNYATFRRYTEDMNTTSSEAVRAREAWAAARKSTNDLVLRHVLDASLDDGQPRFIPLARVDLSKPWDGHNIVFPSPEAFFERYRAESRSGAPTQAASFVPLLEGDSSTDEDTSHSNEEQIALPEAPELKEQRVALESDLADREAPAEDAALVALTNGEVDESKPGEVSLSPKEQQGVLMYIKNKAPDLLEGDAPITTREKDKLWAAEKAGLQRALEEVLRIYRKNPKIKVSEDFVYKLYSDIRGFADSSSTEYSKPNSLGLRASTAEVATRYNRMVRGLASLGADVRLVEQASTSTVEFIRNQWGATITDDAGKRIVSLSVGDVTAPTKDNLRVLMHEVAHLATADLPKWQQVLVADAVERLDGLKGKVFSETLDTRIKNQTLPNSQLAREILAEHLASKGISQPESRNIAERVYDFFVKLAAQAAMLYGQMRGEVFLPSIVARYAEIRFREYVEGIVQSTNDIDTLHGTNRWNQGKQVSIFRPLSEGASLEQYDPHTGKITAQRVIDDSTLATAFNFDTILSDETTEFSQPDSQEELNRSYKSLGLSNRTILGSALLAKISATYSDAKTPFKLIADALVTSPLIRSVDVRIASNNDDIQRLKESSADLKSAAAAIYQVGEHRIIFAPAAGISDITDKDTITQTALHELVHAGTARAISFYQDFKLDGARAINDYFDGDTVSAKKVYEATSQLDRIFKWLGQNELLTDEYGMKDLDEFAAELSNPVFVAQLSVIELPERLKTETSKTLFDAVMSWFESLFNLRQDNRVSKEALTALSNLLQVAGDTGGMRQNIDPRNLAALTKTREELNSDDKVRFDIEQEFAHVNSLIDQYESLFDQKAKALNIGVRDYIVDVLGMRDIYASRETIQTRLGSLNRPIQINDALRLNPATPEQTVVNPIVRNKLLDRVYINLQKAFNRMVAKTQEDSEGISRQEKGIEKAQNQFTRVEDYLFNTIEQNGDAVDSVRDSLRELKTQLRLASNTAGLNSDYAAVLGKLLGNENTGISSIYVDALERLSNEGATNFMLVEALTAASQLNIDWENDSVTNIAQQIAASATGPLRSSLAPLLETDALGKALMAAVVYYGKEKPERMVGFAIKVAKAGKEKTEAIGALRNIINGASMTVEQIEQDIRDARNEATLVGKVKLQFRQKQLELIRKKRALTQLNARIDARNEASGQMSGVLSKLRVEKGIRQPFEYRDGVKVFLTPRPEMGASEVLASSKALSNTSSGITTEAMQILMDNTAWLQQNRNLPDDVRFQVEDQVEKLRTLFQNETEYKMSRARFTAWFQPTYDKIVASGLPEARRLGVALRDFQAKQLQARSLGAAGFEVTKALRDFQRITGVDYDTAVSLFYTPSMRFVESNNQIIANVRTRAEGETLVRDRLRSFLLENPITKPLIQKPGAFEAFHRWYQTNNEANRVVVKFAKDNNVLVQDTRVKVLDPRTGDLRPIYRPALDIGLDTGSRSTRRIGEIVLLLQKTLAQDGTQPWVKALSGVETLSDTDVAAMFTPEVSRLFVAPFALDSGRAQFSSPRVHPDAPRFRAQPIYIRNAWDAAKGDVSKFIENLYELETSTKIDATPETQANFSAYRREVLGMLVGKFKQMSAVANETDESNKLGLQHVPHHVMDARLADDLPSEFIDYMIYDHTTLEKTLEQIAGHSAFGRNLGIDARPDDPNPGWFRRADSVVQQMRRELRSIDLAYALAKSENPLVDSKKLDKLVVERIGKESFDRGERMRRSILLLEDGMREIRAQFTAPGGASRDIGLAQEIVGTIAGLTVQTPKGAIQQLAVLFEPLMKMRMSKAAAKIIGSGIYESTRSAGMTFFNALGAEFIKADKYDRLLNDFTIIRDPANAVGMREIWADTGMGNSFEDNKVKGFIRRGRTALFNVGLRARNPEARLTPALRVFAPFTSAANHINYGSVKSHLIAVDNWIQEGLTFFQTGRLESAAKDPNFKFKATDLPSFSGIEGKAAFAEMQERFMKWGTSFEWEVRRALAERKLGNEIQTNLTPDLIRKVSALALEENSIESSTTTLPSFFKDNAFGRLSAPLVTWPVAKLNQILGAFHNAKGEAEWGATRAAVAAMLFGAVPVGIIVSLLMDKYDEDILRKQSNLADFSFDTDNPNFAAQNANAFVERLTRAGTFGLAGDVVNGIKTYGADNDLRGLSFDKRVLFSNSILAVMGAASNAWHQEGTLTYQTFWRPLASALGGSAAIQNMQILNGISDDLMGVPLFGEEARMTAKINANNYIRAAGRVAGMEVRTGAGQGYISTPITPWIGEMVLSAYGNDRLGFAEAYRNAVTAARDDGKEDPEKYVKEAFAGRHPLKSVFRTAITDSEYHRLLGVLDDSGRRDVTQAISYFNSYGATIGAKPFAGKKESSKKTGGNSLPSAY